MTSATTDGTNGPVKPVKVLKSATVMKKRLRQKSLTLGTRSKRKTEAVMPKPLSRYRMKAGINTTVLSRFRKDQLASCTTTKNTKDI
jgi:hypothetical protein